MTHWDGTRGPICGASWLILPTYHCIRVSNCLQLLATAYYCLPVPTTYYRTICLLATTYYLRATPHYLLPTSEMPLATSEGDL